MQTDATARLTAATPREVAALLRCSRSTVYRKIASGELEAVRLGETGSLRISRPALARFLKRPELAAPHGDPLAAASARHEEAGRGADRAALRSADPEAAS